MFFRLPPRAAGAGRFPPGPGIPASLPRDSALTIPGFSFMIVKMGIVPKFNPKGSEIPWTQGVTAAQCRAEVL